MAEPNYPCPDWFVLYYENKGKRDWWDTEHPTRPEGPSEIGDGSLDSQEDFSTLAAAQVRAGEVVAQGHRDPRIYIRSDFQVDIDGDWTWIEEQVPTTGGGNDR